ncbi:MAG: DUF1592 domain-containing protein [Polyangiaceae bacterium]
MDHLPLRAALFGSLLGFGCAPSVTDSAPAGSGGNSATAGAANNGNGGSSATASGGFASSNGGRASASAGGSSATSACPTQQVPRTALRRLTRFEYANSARSLLDVDTAAVSDLPVDEVTEGFDNNAAVLTVSSLHAEKYVLVSEALAKLAVKNASLVSCDTSKKTEEACAREFAQSFGRRAFRRPISAQDEQLLMSAYAAGKTGGTHAEGIEVMVRAALQSPDFLYRLELTTPTDSAVKLVPLSQFELATRLSFLIWGSGPDDALLDAAARSELSNKEQVATRAKSMLEDKRARAAVSRFYEQWVGTSRLAIATKNTTLFPSFSTELRDAMARELPAFVEYVMWSGDHKLSSLLTAPIGFVTAPLAELYGVSAPGASTPQMVNFAASQARAGILTQAGFLSVQAHPDQTSPVLRGKFVRSKLLCQPPPPPPDDVDITPPEVSEGATARQRFGAHLTAGSSCNGCHTLMDPIGFAFENFDAMGRYRTQENGQNIDVSGEITLTSDAALQGQFNGVRALAEKLAQSAAVRDCMSVQWFRYAAGRLEEPNDACSLSGLRERFTNSGADLSELIVSLTQTDSFWYRAP